MDREDIIKLAREAASEDGTTRPDKNIVLYAAKTSKFLERFAQLVQAAEREACAKVCEQRKIITPEWQLDQHYNQGVSHCAAAIRARGNSETHR